MKDSGFKFKSIFKCDSCRYAANETHKPFKLEIVDNVPILPGLKNSNIAEFIA